MRTVVDGEELLDYLHQRGDYADAPRPHLVVLDLRCPRRAASRSSRSCGSRPPALHPVVVLSSSDRPEDINASYAGGANSYVTKPASLTGLREGVGELARYWMDLAQLAIAGVAGRCQSRRKPQATGR